MLTERIRSAHSVRRVLSIDGGGIYGLAAQDLFAALNAAREHDDELTIGLSMFEIYREQVFDLIAPQLTPSQLSASRSMMKPPM